MCVEWCSYVGRDNQLKTNPVYGTTWQTEPSLLAWPPFAVNQAISSFTCSHPFTSIIQHYLLMLFLITAKLAFLPTYKLSLQPTPQHSFSYISSRQHLYIFHPFFSASRYHSMQLVRVVNSTTSVTDA